jgi:NADPH-dependent 2,4-dienoyl-CoA reductase/sulfur reductase-like enzyme
MRLITRCGAANSGSRSGVAPACLALRCPPLSKCYLTGEVTESGLRLRPASFYADHRIELIESDRVTAIDRAQRRVHRSGGPELAYDHLVLAVGARQRPLQLAAADLDGVFKLRTLADSDALRPRLKEVRDVVLVGAGFIGLELAALGTKLGCQVHVIEVASRPMGRAVSPDISEFFTQAHSRNGVEVGPGVSSVKTGDHVIPLYTPECRQLNTAKVGPGSKCIVFVLGGIGLNVIQGCAWSEPT